jgi:hypothetical protein
MRWRPRSLDSDLGQNRHFMSSFALLRLRRTCVADGGATRYGEERARCLPLPGLFPSPWAETLDAAPPPPLPHSLSHSRRCVLAQEPCSNSSILSIGEKAKGTDRSRRRGEAGDHTGCGKGGSGGAACSAGGCPWWISMAVVSADRGQGVVVDVLLPWSSTGAARDPGVGASTTSR